MFLEYYLDHIHRTRTTHPSLVHKSPNALPSVTVPRTYRRSSAIHFPSDPRPVDYNSVPCTPHCRNNVQLDTLLVLHPHCNSPGRRFCYNRTRPSRRGRRTYVRHTFRARNNYLDNWPPKTWPRIPPARSLCRCTGELTSADKRDHQVITNLVLSHLLRQLWVLFVLRSIFFCL